MRTPILLSFLAAAAAHASPVLTGYLQFEPDPGGTVTMVIAANQTGATFGCNPSFPVCEPLRFLNATLTVDYTDPFGALGSKTVTLIDPIDPGLPIPADWNMDSSLTLLSATFTANLDVSSFFLEDGSFFQSDGLVSGSGDLTAQNIVFLSTSAQPAGEVPEPAMLLPAGLAVLAWLRRR